MDFTTVINTETTDDVESKMADALVALATNGIFINGTFTATQVVIGSLVGMSRIKSLFSYCNTELFSY